METTSFDDILKEEPQKTEEPAETKEPEAQEADFEKEEKRSRKRAHQAKEFEAQGRDPDTGQHLPKEEKKEEPKAEVKEQPKVELTDKEKGLLAEAERHRKRNKELEAELTQYRQQQQQKQPEKQEEKKTFWDDPEGHLKGFEQRLAQRETALTIQVSERIARSKYQDFDEKVASFADDVKTVPGLHAQWLSSSDPAEYAYRYGASKLAVQAAGGMDKWREQVREEERKKLEAEFKKKQEDLEKQRQELPGSLSDVKGASKKSAVVWNGPPSMDEILK